MSLQLQRGLSTSLALRSDESQYEDSPARSFRNDRYEDRSSKPREFRSEESRYGDRDSKPRSFRRPVSPSGTLYIGNLPYAITEEELRQSFMEFGEIVRVTLGTTQDGMSRGFAHIQFSSVEEANEVIRADSEDPIFIMNRDIHLDHAAVQDKPVLDPYHTLFVRPFEGAEEELREVFRDYAHGIADVRILKDKFTGEPRGSAFVEFKDVETATEALEVLKGQKDPSSGREIFLKYAKPARVDFAHDLKSSPEGKKRRFNPKDNERGSRRNNSYGGDWKGNQRTGNYRDS
ncbi:RNA-binding domain-containing protein [Rhizopogon vinicolor AM-OR11-026]|uniref:RNA-binding domain-containing protein n=1 Tax=Rhizopogon vinicolor AM-OR11-026 TaxID=1314800 RepID=A0A1B7MXN0_9AGAM|nr:RNA-binding domain-containing protein [Rhizopogon vinicolor AM-OR11-026]